MDDDGQISNKSRASSPLLQHVNLKRLNVSKRSSSFTTPANQLPNYQNPKNSRHGIMSKVGNYSDENADIYTSATQINSLLQCIVGFYLYYMSSKHLYNYLQNDGRLTAIFVMILGLFGILGSSMKHMHIKTLFIIGLMGAALLAFECATGLDRGIRVDCTFAEMYLRITHAERKMEGIRHDELISQMFTRLHEMDEMMEMMHTGTLHHVELAQKQGQLKDYDMQYIEQKIVDLLKHAERAYRELMKQQQEISSDALNNPSRDHDEVKDRLKIQQDLKQKIEAVDSVIDAIQTKRVSDQQVTIEEYQILLDVLEKGLGGKSVKEMVNQLQEVKTVWQRKNSNDYKSVDVGGHISQLQHMHDKKSAKRQEFKEKFDKILVQHDNSTGEYYAKSLNQALSSLPEHCLKEMEWMSRIYYTCWIILLSLGVNVYLQVTQQVVQLIK
eukprot:TRINITY_DN17169_c0_g1_i1.p2 TRINITY_DN17169_c0_g1~~TRINITY_DN17169_c0_g1_i1.p2  ORF type:complete len:442 (+),score=41.29 TRINITY_DN17169_c0_g1_i1:62-1387(+)